MVHVMILKELCDDLMGDVEGAQGCALVDLGTGLPLAVSVAPGASDGGVGAAMEVLAAAGTDFFCGIVNRDLRAAMSDPALPEGFVQEVQTATEDCYHFMSVVPGKEQTVLILVTDRTLNLGLGWATMRTMLDRVSAAASRPRADPAAAMASEGLSPLSRFPPATRHAGASFRARHGPNYR